ncbi:unnamed protein product [Ambrosiozyma monospora]|uniref:Unnamed protein product n=1 Tax=Ambrosiozyma monospora TaxID=43982 RepID=A0ACB5TMM0_AMBMO|nr:unnamed protein product [Ambrosiozyma monospora]
MADKWKSEYKKLEQVSFGYTNKKISQPQTLKLLDLVNCKDLEEISKNCKQLNSLITQKLIDIRSKIETNIIAQKQNLSKEYDLYKVQFMRNDDTKNREKSIEQCKKKFAELESNVVELIQTNKELPAFEDLISTKSQNSTKLSESSISNIKALVKLFDTQANDLVPKITELSNELYEFQSKRLSLRRQLQQKMVTTTLVTITKIQWNIMKANATLDNDIAKDLSVLKECELQLSIVSDLPLIFGVWSIANLNNLKYAVSMSRLLHKTNEIFEMLKFMEINNRTKWLNKFLVANGGDEKLGFLKLDDDSKTRFINEHFNSHNSNNHNRNTTIIQTIIIFHH